MLQLIKMIGEFIQTQVFGMQWLYVCVERLLTAVHVDPHGKWGGSLHFFLYDTVKITLLLCLLIFAISFVQSYFPPERSRKILGRFRGVGANCIAALLGTVTPFCSCSSIPLFIGFTGAGLPLGVTFSFLISSPMVDLGSLVLLTGIFGGEVALLYVLLGLAVAVVGGTVIEKLQMEDQLEDVVRMAAALAGEAQQVQLTAADRLRYARDQMTETLRKVFPYVLAGVAIGAVIHNWIPREWVERLLGSGNPANVLLAVLAGAPMYADIFGTVPVAQALLAKGALLGTVLSFMMSVTTLSLPSLMMLRRAVKPRLLAVFTAICTVGIVLVGYTFHLLSPLLG